MSDRRRSRTERWVRRRPRSAIKLTLALLLAASGLSGAHAVVDGTADTRMAIAVGWLLPLGISIAFVVREMERAGDAPATRRHREDVRAANYQRDFALIVAATIGLASALSVWGDGYGFAMYFSVITAGLLPILLWNLRAGPADRPDRVRPRDQRRGRARGGR